MGRLDDVSLDHLHEQLEQTQGNVPTQRVLAAIGRKQGATLDELAERHDVAEKTVRNWLDRFAERPVAEAPYDEHRPGRPTKLSREEMEQLFADLHQSPAEFGYDREGWFPELVRHYVAEQYDVDYTLRHTYRLMDEAGLSYRTARPHQYRAEPDIEAATGETQQQSSPE